MLKQYTCRPTAKLKSNLAIDGYYLLIVRYNKTSIAFVRDEHPNLKRVTNSWYCFLLWKALR